eukprot:10243458-Prorocentrum_lima.AAC.1
MGDWNITPDDLLQSGWLTTAQGDAVAPSNVSVTSTAWVGKLYDCDVMDSYAKELVVSMEAETAEVEG